MHLALLTLSLTLLASTSAQNTNQSAPFNLVLSSRNKTLSGKYLEACHSGAAIETLCLSTGADPGTPHTVYNLNTSSDAGGSTTDGVITWTLRGGNFNLSQPLGLSVDYASNVALPLFSGLETTVSFDAEERLYIKSFLDDTQDPPRFGERAYYRWFVCRTYYGSYT
jgi:hypothetical protein